MAGWSAGSPPASRLALGVDIIFPEPDRFSPESVAAETCPGLPPSLAEGLAALPRNDAVLAEAFRSVPTVLGVGVTFETPTGPAPRVAAAPIRGIGGDPLPFLQSYPALVRSLPEITAAERGRAALVGNADRDGILRRVPLFIAAGGNLVAGLSVESLRVALGAPAIGIVMAPQGVVGGRIGDLQLPTDRQARAYPYFAPPQSSAIVSAADVLKDSFDPQVLAGKIVLLGVTGLGLVDIKQTPLGLMQGIEVQAQLIESMLTGSLLQRPIVLPRIEMGIALLLGLVVIFALPYRPARRSRLRSSAGSCCCRWAAAS